MSGEFAGWFRFGRLVDTRPQALSSWRVTTHNSQAAAAITRLLGGLPEEWQTKSADRYEVLTDTSNVRIVLDGPHCITNDMKKWSINGLSHHCDGQQFLSPHRVKGDPCGCPDSVEERKERARSRLGPQPNSEIVFRIDEIPNLGYFRMHSISWKFAESVALILNLMNSTRDKLACALSLVVVELKSATGGTATCRQPLLLPEAVAAA
ncbi:hypothetical protein ACQEV4_02580 [Streptomyces shenzhenensis]|uniref:recombination directionality factor n=1 Tax=Streptomyces shenzhenensis TaxID=943815 RepID=UPI003D8AFA03